MSKSIKTALNGHLRRVFNIAFIVAVGYIAIPSAASFFEQPIFSDTVITYPDQVKVGQDPEVKVRFCVNSDHPVAVTYSRRLVNSTRNTAITGPSAAVTVQPGCQEYTARLAGLNLLAGTTYTEWTYSYHGRFRDFVQTNRSNTFEVIQ